jgi:hypothetical protein
MSEILQFPNKKPEVNDENPFDVLTHIADAMKRGEIECDQMIVTWCKHDGSSMSMGYKVAGDDSLTSAVGLLEITKSALME